MAAKFLSRATREAAVGGRHWRQGVTPKVSSGHADCAVHVGKQRGDGSRGKVLARGINLGVDDVISWLSSSVGVNGNVQHLNLQAWGCLGSAGEKRSLS